MEFKDRIHILREKAKLSSTQLATVFNKSEAAIRAWEAGRTKPDADTLLKISEYFGCSIDYLLGKSDFKDSNEYNDYIKTENALIEQLNCLDSNAKKRLISLLSVIIHNYAVFDNNLDDADYALSYFIKFLESHSQMVETALGILLEVNSLEHLSKEETTKYLSRTIVFSAFKDASIRILDDQYRSYYNDIFTAMGYPPPHLAQDQNIKESDGQ